MSDPFAPVSAPAGPTTPCPQCGQPFESARGQYSPTGQLVCASCAAAPEIQSVQGAASKKDQSMFIGSLSSVGIGLLSFCVQHAWFFWLFPTIALVSGVAILLRCLRDDTVKRSMGWRYVPTLVASIIGALIGLGSLGLHVLAKLLLS